MSEYLSLAKTDDVPVGEGRTFVAGSKQIAVFNVNGEFHAIDNTCVHQGGPLGEGFLEGTMVTCPWHAWRYDVTTGECSFNPGARVDSYTVRVENGEIQVAV